ncbi:MAG: helix-turn-helix domain-containing protein [Candidatus Thiodiazotropha sp.]
MSKILELVESLATTTDDPNGKAPVQHLGFISCGDQVHIRLVPFYEPCIIMVLSGRKVIFDEQGTISCEAGSVITVPAPASYDLRNEPDKARKRYKALVIPFKHEDIEHLRDMHGIAHIERSDQVRVLKYEPDESLSETVRHYLESPNDAQLLKHRLTEILLILMKQDSRVMSYSIARENWSQRVRSILSSDLIYEWTIGEVSNRLATSETTLRRKLREEGTSFREIIYELRLASGLFQLLQTTMPVYQVAFECGYQSVSRFTSNFRKRFGLSPTEFRNSLDEKG